MDSSSNATVVAQTAQPARQDYMKVPGPTLPSFHLRTGKPVVTDAPANTYGYPIPGVQSPNASSVMAMDYFVTYGRPCVERYILYS